MHPVQSPRTDDGAIESEIIAKGLTAPRVTPADIEANIASEHYFTAIEGAEAHDDPGGIGGLKDYPKALDLLTFCVLVLRNGFTVTGESACASPENFDAEVGKKIARTNAVNKVWPLMGYELRSKLAAVPADFRDRVRLEQAELDAKIDALAKFMPTETFGKLTTDEQDRMTAQLAAMQDYSGCLAERVAAF